MKVILFYIVLSWGFVCLAQQTESEKLLEQAEKLVYSDPAEAKRISEHNLKISTNEKEIMKSYYIQALSFYIMGEYSKSLESAFMSKKKAADLGNDEWKIKSNDLINRTLNFLQLHVPNQNFVEKIKDSEPEFQAEDLFQKANLSLLRNHSDSAIYYMNEAKSVIDLKESAWANALYLKLEGDVFFKELKLDSAVANYQSSTLIAQKINNPFLLYDLNQKLANAYLALDNISKFQEHNQLLQKLSNETFKLENDASNSAHMLISKDLDDKYLKLKNGYKFGLMSVVILLVLAIFIKIIFYIRNRNKLKMYRNMLEYLHRQKLPEPNLNTTTEEKQEAPKSPMILKESENQILADLEKFEAGKKFTHKDMSLRMLAAQLNTNTKYLSEVINRQKQKNFNSYINELRINYITEKIKSDPNYLNYKVSYLAEECGFSSHSTFTTVFKSIVGVSPIMFVEFVKDELKREKSEPALNE